MKLHLLLLLIITISSCGSLDKTMRMMAYDTSLKVLIEKPRGNETLKGKTILLNGITFNRGGQDVILEDKYQSYVLKKLALGYPDSKVGITEGVRLQLNNYLTGRLPQRASEYILEIEINGLGYESFPMLNDGEYCINTVFKIIENKTGKIVSIGSSVVTSGYSDALTRSTDEAIEDLTSSIRSISFPGAGFDETPEKVIAFINSGKHSEAEKFLEEKMATSSDNESNLIYLESLVEISKGNVASFEKKIIRALKKGYSREKAIEALARSREVARILKR